jgi:hypothetical protein
MKIDELIEHLETDAEWAFANEWESPICLSDDINDALTILRTIAILNQMDILDKIKYVLEDYL